MMFHTLASVGILIPSAHAQTLRTAGQGGAGVNGMWSHICSVLPCVTDFGAGGSSLIVALSNAVINFIFPFIATVAVIMVMYAGVLIITSDGADEKVSEAKKIILYASVGVILSIMTTSIVAFVQWYLSQVLT